MITGLFDKAPCGYFSFTDDGIIFEVNETLASVLNYHREDLPGKNVETIFTIATRIFFQTHLFPMIKMHGHAEEIFLTVKTKENEHLPVLLNAKRIEWQNDSLNLCVFIVVPNRKKFEDELVAARNTAQKALEDNSELVEARSHLQLHTEMLEEQMEQLGRQKDELQQFSHVVTHNLKEPLRKIMMFSSKLQQEGESPALAKLLKSANQMREVVTGLQQYVWVTEKDNEFVNIDLNEIVKKAITQLYEEGKDEYLEHSCENMPWIEGDAEQLQLMMYHLLSNAIRFRKNEKAKVEIGFTILKQNKFRTVKGKYLYEDFLRLSIRDQGIGFDPLYTNQVFDLFKTLHTSSGQGLGLALCKKIAGNHSGYLDAYSKPGEFAEFYIYLPLKQPQED